MNEHFFDIKKEKQDRIINAVLKVFAKNGYKRASTDDMVKEASISKGLLFHYFTSKDKMYEFVYRYSVKYMTVELTGVLAGTENDYFLLKGRLEGVKYKVLKSFPYMPLFLAEAELEEEQRTEDILSIRKEWHATLRRIEEKADYSLIPAVRSGVEKEKLCKLTDYMLEGILREAYSGGAPDADAVYEQALSYLGMMRELMKAALTQEEAGGAQEGEA